MTSSSTVQQSPQIEGISAGSPTENRPPIHLTPETLQLVADFFKVLSESSRLQIVCALKTGQKNVTEIIEATGLGQANVSKHLKILAQAGIVSRQQQGVCVYYQIASVFVFDLCELVCNSLLVQIQQQSQKIAHLEAFRQP